MADRQTDISRKYYARKITFADFPTSCLLLLEAQQRLRRLSSTRLPILLCGERGTGKSLLAQAVHQDYPGLLQACHGGTLFLDEFSEIFPEQQIALVDLIEGRMFTRIGGTMPIHADVRFVFATNRSIEEMRAHPERWRPDFLDRTTLLAVHVPSLRERIGDLPLLVRTYVAQICGRLQRTPPVITPSLLGALAERPWPGNIRQLRLVIEETLALHEVDVLLPEHLPPVDPVSQATRAILPLRAQNRIAARQALDACGGNLSEAARILQVSRPTLRKLLG